MLITFNDYSNNSIRELFFQGLERLISNRLSNGITNGFTVETKKTPDSKGKIRVYWIFEESHFVTFYYYSDFISVAAHSGSDIFPEIENYMREFKKAITILDRATED